MPRPIRTTVSETEHLAKELSGTVRGGEVFALIGPLGAGKTTFTKHFAKALGYTGKVTSPTFVLMQTYRVRRQGKPFFIHHLDLYRIEDQQELTQSGITELWGKPDSITLIEWADKAPDVLPPHTTVIHFKNL